MPWRRKWQPSILAWKIPWTEESGRLQYMGSQRVRHDLASEQQQIHPFLKLSVWFLISFTIMACIFVFKVCVYDQNPICIYIKWRRKWQLTPVFLPGKFHGQRSLAGYSPRGCKESDMSDLLNNNSCISSLLPHLRSHTSLSGILF